MSELPDDLLTASAYPDGPDQIELIETHLSWVFLAGAFAYKVKKPVHFNFVDFRTLAQRRYFCEEELRCNRQFADALYVSVVPIVADASGKLRIQPGADPAVAVDWAVQMRRFDHRQQADLLLERNDLGVEELEAFGGQLARRYRAGVPFDGAFQPQQPVLANFDALAEAGCDAQSSELIAAIEPQVRKECASLAQQLIERQSAGYVRECHGDLHLANIVRLADGLCAFDALEFNEALRQIDVIADIAFLFMDCLVRGRPDLAYGFLDGYLNVSGDYAGVLLLPFYARYRSMVRAKVSALRLQQNPTSAEAVQGLTRYLEWTAEHLRRPPGALIVMNGVSGTGKSYWARQLAASIGALRLRSDVLRKVSAGLAPEAQSPSAVSTGLYDPHTTEVLYARLAGLSEGLLRAGETVIVDATCLRRSQREQFYRAAKEAGALVRVLHFQGPLALLSRRIEQRAAQGGDPSDADLTVLQAQLEQQERPGDDEPAVTLNVEALSLPDVLAALGVQTAPHYGL